ncbi:uncharacterized protein LOC112343584 [Selaginella moellendorffii]|uniref:uncharacterized protein LOC112343584 n=1 Tax=Selaginella moellendorffii TaxID=88036 RepID=UPI000D1D11E9|nr:uncharacterized protein LOC112343584 [Selaginella moellendorffii]|eukprot:XP_024523073.1 uncharacterized protein LOC112343584 [Selaginella moellendorffii]
MLARLWQFPWRYRPTLSIARSMRGAVATIPSPLSLGFSRSYSRSDSEDFDEEEEVDDDEDLDIDPEVWDEDPDGAKNLDPTYEFPKPTTETKFYGFFDKNYKPSSESEVDTEDDEDVDYSFSTDYKFSPFARAGVSYEDWIEMKNQHDSMPKKRKKDDDLDVDDFDVEKLRGDIPFDKWTELKRQFSMTTDVKDEDLDFVRDRPKGQRSGLDPNPNESLHYKTMPKNATSEERMRYFRGELDKYLRIANKYDYTPRFFSSDPHIERVKAKLSTMKPDADGIYRNTIEYISDIDVLLYAYRVVKARKMGPGTDCTTIPIDNIKMDWFYKTQKELRDGTYEFPGSFTVYVKKKSFKK